MKSIIMRALYAKEYEMAIEMMEAEHCEAHIIAKRFLHVDSKILEKLIEQLSNTK